MPSSILYNLRFVFMDITNGGIKMAKGEENLIPVTERSKDEAREISRKGGINSGKARREKADLRKQAQLWLETDVTHDKNGNPMTGAQMMMAVAAKEIAKGNPKFWELMRDTAGQKPVEKVMIAEVEQDVIDEVERAVLNDTPASD